MRARATVPVLAGLTTAMLAGLSFAHDDPQAASDTDGGQSVEVMVPADMGLDSLAARRQEQLATASDFRIPHDFGFTDRREQSGITFHHRIVDDAGPRYKAVHYDHGNGIAAADVDGDRLPDLYFVSQVGANELWLNLGDGKFRDATAQAGVALEDRIGVSASFADVDNDGDADLFVTTVRGGNVLFENDGKGRFRDVTTEAGVGYSGHSSAALFFDYDRDGLLDLFVANVGVYTTEERGRDGYYVGMADAFRGHMFPERVETSILYRNLGDRRFRDVTRETLLVDRSWTGDAAAADLDGDGWTDLYVLDMQGPDAFWRNSRGKFFVDRTQRFFPRTPPGAMGVAVFDWNGDGRLDLYLTDMHSDMVEDVGPEREKLKARVPFGSPEHPGIAGNAFFQAGERGFEEISDRIGAETYWPWGVSAGDLNADGWEDLFVTASMNFPFRYGINSVLLNDRGETLRDSEFVLGVEPRAGSLVKPWFEVDCSATEDGDPMAGWKDLPKGDADEDSVEDDAEQDDETADHSHTAGGELCTGRSGKVTVMAARGSRSSVVLDLDGDGDLDVVTNEFFDLPQVLISDLAQRGDPSWVKIELEGTRSNRDGLGALVKVVAGGRTQLQLHDGKSGYLSHSRLPLYFGLGEAETVDRIEVTWPSGEIQVVDPPAARVLVRVVEPEAVSEAETEP